MVKLSWKKEVILGLLISSSTLAQDNAPQNTPVSAHDISGGVAVEGEGTHIHIQGTPPNATPNHPKNHHLDSGDGTPAADSPAVVTKGFEMKIPSPPPPPSIPSSPW